MHGTAFTEVIGKHMNIQVCSFTLVNTMDYFLLPGPHRRAPHPGRSTRGCDRGAGAR